MIQIYKVKVFKSTVIMNKYAEYINELHYVTLNITEFKGKDLDI